jgi:hypothetical protein
MVLIAALVALIEAGALVIPMDNTNQAVGTPFNLKAYGLVNRLLQNEIPVQWAISATKAKDGVDFSVAAERLRPTAVANSSTQMTAVMTHAEPHITTSSRTLSGEL